jgi:raffinose/stachyose/melibiose transport system permease protein
MKINAGHKTKNLSILIDRIIKIIINFVLYCFCLSYLFPFIWLTYNSFKDRKQFNASYINLPIKIIFDNYKTIFSGNEAWHAIRNSTFYTVLTIVLVLAISFLIAYFISRYRFRGRRFLSLFFLMGMLIPIHALLIPIYIQFSTIGLLNRFITLLIPYVTFGLPRDIYLFDSYMRGIPQSIEEAAFIDGATVNQIMTRIIFPMCMPIVGTIVILDFVGIWNEFPFALVLNSRADLRTIPIWLTTYQSQYSSNVPVRLTAILISMLPIIIIYLLFSDRMMKGMVAGAIKG